MIKFETENSAYEIDRKNDTLTRFNKTNEELRRDGEPLKILQYLKLEIGESAYFLLDVREDGIPTLRSTSPVVSIEEI